MLLTGLGAGPAAEAQLVTPVEIRQVVTPYNRQSTNGAPTPPTSSQQEAAGLTTTPPTARQFRGAVVFGGDAAPRPVRLPDPNSPQTGQTVPGVTYGAKAASIGLPRLTVGSTVTTVLSRVQVGAPFVNRQLDFRFGAPIPVPADDILGVLLTDNPAPEDYWLAEPFKVGSEHPADAGYYWSPHARKVYAARAGPIEIVWKMRQPVASRPPGVENVDYQVDSGQYFRLRHVRYVVSTTPYKETRTIYWTEAGFSRLGRLIEVPSARVSDVAVVYNNQVPSRVEDPYVGENEFGFPPLDGENDKTPSETRTLWFDRAQGFIRAYNREGRVLVELLGDLRGQGNAREQLAMEIVEIVRQPSPTDVSIELGERLTMEPPERQADDSRYFPEEILSASATFYAFRHTPLGSSRGKLYAVRETQNQNDLWVHWLEEGSAGLRWPVRTVRYELSWPVGMVGRDWSQGGVEVQKYSHYIRPPAGSDAEAAMTAVPLPNQNAGQIAWQDELPRSEGGEQLGAKLTPDQRFYTYLDPGHPAHRTLLRFSTKDQVGFERVFSWLSPALLDQQEREAAVPPGAQVSGSPFVGSVVTNLVAWDPDRNRLDLTEVPLASPRVVRATVEVGARLAAPTDERVLDPRASYWAGHLRREVGVDYDSASYLDPFAAGFEEANRGAILPVNARPGKNRLEVWWFREGTLSARPGFGAVYWPSVIGRYTLRWPLAPREIVLASNDGSGGLVSLEAKGTIYVQNDPTLDGYNPNEEHALMLGGQAYALRDDLNIFGAQATEGTYTSDPFVLLRYVAADGRPAMVPFKILREKPGEAMFDYRVDAGTILQAPMPLPLLERPMVAPRVGEPGRSLNEQIGFLPVANPTAAGSAPYPTTLETTELHFFRPFDLLTLQRVPADPTDAVTTRWFYPTSVDVGTRTIVGIPLESSHPPVEVTGEQVLDAQGIPVPRLLRYRVGPGKTPPGLAAGDTAVVVDAGGQRAWTVQVSAADTGAGSVDVQFGADEPVSDLDLWLGAGLLLQPTQAGATFASGPWRVGSSVVPATIQNASLREFYSGLTLQDRKGNVWVYRGPHDANDPAAFRMQFYYRTLPGFFFPGLETQPPVGTVTPYLRNERTAGERDYVGEAVEGDADNDRQGDGNPLWVTYRGVWPANAPVLQRAETLTLPRRGLPAIRGQSSLEIVYQQSAIQQGADHPSVVLHDPTRQKEFRLGPEDNGSVLDAVPDSVNRQQYRGMTYFPNLPPHLSERFFLDPNRGDGDGFKTFGALVFSGAFVDEALGEDYLHLNLLSPADLASLKGLCKEADARKTLWDQAIDGLATTLERFVESDARPGTFRVDPDWNPDGDQPGVRVGATHLARVDDDDIAVDSYALTATGPETGFVSLIAGNGLAFTPPEEPTSVLVLRVADRLYPGELKVIESPNPLAEKVTLQQVVDLAGNTSDYLFEWRIASPVDGLPPLVYQNTPAVLLGSGETWQHLDLPIPGDAPASVHLRPEALRIPDVRTRVVPIRELMNASGRTTRDGRVLSVLLPDEDLFARVRVGAAVVATDRARRAFPGTVVGLVPESRGVRVSLDAAEEDIPSDFDPVRLDESSKGPTPESVVFHSVDLPVDGLFTQFWLSLDLDPQLGARVFVDGAPVLRVNLEDPTPTQSAPAGFLPLTRAYRLDRGVFAGGESIPDDPTRIRHHVVVELYSDAVAGAGLTFDLKLEAYQANDITGVRTDWLKRDAPDGVRMILGETADVRSISDNYAIMRYAPKPAVGALTNWSTWTEPQLVEGYIKRVLKGINPFNQRVKNLFESRVNTDVSILTQAGPRWEGDIALNLDQINNYGLIEIYETVLRRGRGLSIDAGINFGPANDALLLAAGYLNDLYMMLGNEAAADAANPTIGIGTKDRTYGDIATSLFSFKGQVSSLLEEELALLRGRDDFLQPGVTISPIYNRLVWNYTRGIDSGEVVYALNYNIQEQNDTGVNGVVDADDARKLFPQGHGDAYGHYLTAAKGYFSLLMDTDFDWIPRTEAVLILGKPVQVDYTDERKFAAAAVAVARTGRQVFDLTWRQHYQPGTDRGWEELGETRTNTRRTLPSTRFWGMDHWASRTLQGAYVNWVVGNTILPAEDPDPEHEGIQRIDRQTVPELRELTSIAEDLQTALDNAEAHLSPLGLPANALAFDINPNTVLGADPQTHFEQVYERASGALRNAVVAFDDAKDVTRLMRSESDSLAEFQAQIASQEAAYQTRLTELYGSPYPDDIGPGKTYPTGYAGEDAFHFSYVDNVELTFGDLGDSYGLQPRESADFILDFQSFPGDWAHRLYTDPLGLVVPDMKPYSDQYLADTNHITYTLSSHGFFEKPEAWGSRRATPGRIQAAISDIIKARNQLAAALNKADGAKDDVDKAIQLFQARVETHKEIRGLQKDTLIAKDVLEAVKLGDEIMRALADAIFATQEISTSTSVWETDQITIAGFSVGGNVKTGVVTAINIIKLIAAITRDAIKATSFTVARSLEIATDSAERWTQFEEIAPREWDMDLKASVADIGGLLWALQVSYYDVNQRLQESDDAQRRYRGLLSEGNRIRDEREVFRQRAAAVIQGYRTRDAAFRIFRNEKLERYKSLFDLAARYTLLAANAYDYETGLLNTPEGRAFVQRILGSRALGVVQNGEPQFAGSNTGDPGLSSVLAEMKADWDVLKGRLGFNNPDAYGTTASLRTEFFRLLPGADSDEAWRDILEGARTDNLLRDADVRRYCLQIQDGSDLPVPGLVLEFPTTIARGLNLFGKPLASGDHALASSAFATKIHAAGIALEGYVGMETPVANTAAVGFAGGTSPADPGSSFLDPKGLAANPYVYLIPVGVDSMRTPPLGDASTVRTWNVDDVTIPLPFNIGASEHSFAKLWQTTDSLTEPLFGIRKHSSFRPVPSAAVFNTGIYNGTGGLAPSPYTSRRLIGRSAWNSRWKLVIPGHTLLNNPEEGLDRLIRSVRDVRLHFVTYSYSGN